jgi:hypothetical protein
MTVAPIRQKQGASTLQPAERKGLAWVLERGARVVELAAEGATIRTTSGSLLGFHRPHANTGAVLP